MTGRFLLISILFPVLAAAASAAPPVTGKESPSPTQEAARRWAVAAFQTPLLDYGGGSAPRSEAARMLLAVRRGEPLGPGVGWFAPAESRFDWQWLSRRYDADRNGRISRAEFQGEAEFFDRLDRDGDRSLTSEDLDWSEQSPWVRQEAQALRFFRSIDGNGDGRISEGEMQEYFKRRSGEKGYLKPEDLRTALAGEPARKKAKQKRVSQEVWLQSLLASDLGSPLEGPRVGEIAPDFALPTHDDATQIALSNYRGKKPVVLIFGSFT